MNEQFIPLVQTGNDAIDKNIEITNLQMEIIHFVDSQTGMFVMDYLDSSDDRNLDRILDVLRKIRDKELEFSELMEPQYSDVFPLYPPNRIHRDEQQQGVKIIEEWD